MGETTFLTPANTLYSLLAFIAYLVVIVCIGIFASKSSSSGLREYFIAGRKLNKIIVALSAVASGRSSWLLLGVTGMSYLMGAPAVWAVVGYIIVEMLLFLFYATRLRKFSSKYDCITLPDFFSERFQDKSGTLRIITTSVIIIFMVSYVSSQFIAGGKALSVSFNINPFLGVLITSGIVLTYTLLGGFLAVSITDLIQALFMLFALLILPIIAIYGRGGLCEITKELRHFNPNFLNSFSISVGTLLGFIGIGLGSPGNPHIIVRYMSIKNPDDLRFSAVIGTIWNVLMAWGALFIGLAGRAYFPNQKGIPNSDPENIFPLLAQNLLHPLIYGIIIASIFAAIMSTADSQLLVAASSIIRDIYEKTIKKGETIPQRKLVLYSKLCVLTIGAVSIVIGVFAKKIVFWLVLFAWAGLGASLGPTSILSIFWKGTTKAGVIAGFLTGTVTVILWHSIPPLKSIIYELIPAFLLSAIATIVVSLITTRPENVDKIYSGFE